MTVAMMKPKIRSITRIAFRRFSFLRRFSAACSCSSGVVCLIIFSFFFTAAPSNHISQAMKMAIGRSYFSIALPCLQASFPVFFRMPRIFRHKKIPVKLTGILENGMNYSLMPMTTPEPTVRPPSRIAKRRPFSIAIGVISSTSMSTLSPGMHISTPSGREMTPVTSVVRK